MTFRKAAARIAGAAAIAFAALSVLLILAGCLPSQTSVPADTTSAKAYLPLAEASLATTAPDAKLLLVQTTAVVNATATPVWSYLFGSPKTNTLYVVDGQKGKVAPPFKYGTVKFTAQEWASVPSADSWKIDSPEAYQKAAAAYGKASGKSWVMGFVTMVPKTTTSTVEPFVWSVTFDPEAPGDTRVRTLNVNASTGAVTKPK
jgi:hypothetical protein